MRNFTLSQDAILNNMASLNDEDLDLSMPFNIARRPSPHMSLFGREFDEIIFIKGYAKAAEALVQKGILIRDKGEVFFFLTSFGVDYIKGLKS